MESMGHTLLSKSISPQPTKENFYKANNLNASPRTPRINLFPTVPEAMDTNEVESFASSPVYDKPKKAVNIRCDASPEKRKYPATPRVEKRMNYTDESSLENVCEPTITNVENGNLNATLSEIAEVSSLIRDVSFETLKQWVLDCGKRSANRV
jgi:hypothetical protein